MDTNYFVCTLGQAALLNKTNPHDFETINQFIDARAMKYSEFPAIGFPKPSKAGDSWGQHVFSGFAMQSNTMVKLTYYSSFSGASARFIQYCNQICPVYLRTNGGQPMRSLTMPKLSRVSVCLVGSYQARPFSASDSVSFSVVHDVQYGMTFCPGLSPRLPPYRISANRAMSQLYSTNLPTSILLKLRAQSKLCPFPLIATP